MMYYDKDLIHLNSSCHNLYIDIDIQYSRYKILHDDVIKFGFFLYLFFTIILPLKNSNVSEIYMELLNTNKRLIIKMHFFVILVTYLELQKVQGDQVVQVVPE